MKNGQMRSLRELFNGNRMVWVYINEELHGEFLRHAESDGFRTSDGRSPTELSSHKVYCLQNDMTIQYVRYEYWSKDLHSDNDNNIRIDYPKIAVSESSEELYYVYSSELLSIVEVTKYEIGKVSPADVKAKVSEIMNGHESEYKHISYQEYGEIFA